MSGEQVVSGGGVVIIQLPSSGRAIEGLSATQSCDCMTSSPPARQAKYAGVPSSIRLPLPSTPVERLRDFPLEHPRGHEPTQAAPLEHPTCRVDANEQLIAPPLPLTSPILPAFRKYHFAVESHGYSAGETASAQRVSAGWAGPDEPAGQQRINRPLGRRIRRRQFRTAGPPCPSL